MKILIDADGCPVTKLATNISKEFNIQTILFCDTSHIFNIDNVEVVVVEKGKDSADFALVNRIEPNDIVITQDYGLAAMALSKQGRPLTQNGFEITDINLTMLLTLRHENSKLRKSGKHIKGPSKRKNIQNINFENKLKELINNENINRSGFF